MKILVDMNLSPRWVKVLAGAGISSMHWSTAGPTNARDPVIIEYATQDKKPSVIQIRSDDVSPEASAAATEANIAEFVEIMMKTVVCV